MSFSSHSSLETTFSAIIFICGLQEMLLYMLHWSHDPLSFQILIFNLPLCPKFFAILWMKEVVRQSGSINCEWSRPYWPYSCHIFSNAKDFLSLSSVFHWLCSTAVCVWSTTAYFTSNSVEDFSDVFGCASLPFVCFVCRTSNKEKWGKKITKQNEANLSQTLNVSLCWTLYSL